MNSTVESALRELCALAASFHARGYAFGSTGNISLRMGDEVWITPTGASFRDLAPDRIACIDLSGASRNNNKPSKEFPFHLGCYRSAGSRASAIVHLHSTWTVALSCMEDLDPVSPLPVFTPYYLMRVAPLAVVPYFRPGSDALASAIEAASVHADCLLLRNHGLVSLGSGLSEAADRAEELEETAKLFFLLRQEKVRLLTPEERAEIELAFRAPR